MNVPPMSGRQIAEATGDYAAAGLPEPMTGERFRSLWKATGLSLRDLAAMLGMRGRHAATHLREMADGVRPVPGPTGVAVEALAFGWRPGAERLDDDTLADIFGDYLGEGLRGIALGDAVVGYLKRYIAGEPWQ